MSEVGIGDMTSPSQAPMSKDLTGLPKISPQTKIDPSQETKPADDVPLLININDLSSRQTYNPGSMNLQTEQESDEMLQRIANGEMDNSKLATSDEVLEAIMNGKRFYEHIETGSAADYVRSVGGLKAEDGYLYHGTWDIPLKKYRLEGIVPSPVYGVGKGSWWSSSDNLAASAQYRRLLRIRDNGDARRLSSNSSIVEKKLSPPEIEIWTGKDWKLLPEYVSVAPVTV